tara:strand:- start:62 stop:1156 length:1095 start_codon:yes stop_codon:yes gene_type:complete
MAISHLKIKSLRNYKEKSFSFNKGLTVIFGKNGSGKTSILEAIHLLSIGKSFKTNKKRELINKNKKELILNGLFIKNDIETTISMSIHKKEKQKIKINNKNIFTRKDLLNKNNVVVLSPEEQKITKGPAKERRVFFDKLFSICSKKYLKNIQDYNRVLKQRNSLLKTNIKNNKNNLEPWDDLLIKKGINLWTQKNKKFNEFKNLFLKTTQDYNSNTKISLNYKEIKIDKTTYKNKIKANKERDFLLKRTTFGPHLDDFYFNWNNKPIRSHGSQGENKTFLILLKLTELKYLKKTTNNCPILLLDDLFATIDIEKSKKTIKMIKKIETENKKKIQTIITTTDLFNLKKLGFKFNESKNQIYELRS